MSDEKSKKRPPTPVPSPKPNLEIVHRIVELSRGSKKGKR